MKNNTNSRYTLRNFRLPIFLLGLFTLASCNKYEEGPFMSFNSPDNRVAGTWIITQATEYENTETRDVTTDYDDDSFTFNDDGSSSHSFNDGVNPVTSNGSWELLNDAETLKLTESWTFAAMTFTNVDNWAIHRLKSKEMILEKTENDVRTRIVMSAQ